MEQIERIKKMEERLNRSSQVILKLSAALDDYVESLEDHRALKARMEECLRQEKL